MLHFFQELLQNAELEDQARDTCPFFSSRSVRNNRRHQHTQGGSLQDLVDSVNSEELGGDYLLSGPTGRRSHHQQNSRHNTTKYSSSVSSRQREGGSLPSNVNVSSSYSPASLACIDTFLFSNYRSSGISTKKDKDLNKKDLTNKDGTINSSSSHYYQQHQNQDQRNDCLNNNSRDELTPLIHTVHAVNANDKNHTIINIDEPDENRHLLAHDSLAQVIIFSKLE